MNLEAKLHTAWAANATLHAALPASRVFTGRIPRDTTKPCATIRVPGGIAGKMSDKARERSVDVRIQHWCDLTDFGTGEDIQGKIEAAFDNYSVDLDDSFLVKIRHENSFWLQEEGPTDTIWQFVTQFTALVQKDRTL